MQDQLRTTCRQLLRDGAVQVVIGYGQSRAGGAVHPVLLTDPRQADQLVWNEHCHHNLAMYLKRPEVRALGRAAMVVKACDERAIVVLQQESQLDRQQIYLIGVVCEGSGPTAAKCQTCTQRSPRFADMVVGASPGEPSSLAPASRYAELERFLALPPDQRLQYWQQELARCTKCYACRQACPLCYCTRCIVDKNRPACVDPSATPRGNFAWHITRAFHLAGRCVGCGECARACPANIDLNLLNLSLARAAEASFGYRAGEQVDAELLIGSYREQDQESFVR